MEEKKKGSPSTYLVPVAILLAGIFISAAILFKDKLPGLNKESAAPKQEEATPPSQGETAGTEVVAVSVEDDAVKGKEDAKVTIIEFSDFQCPYCSRYVKETYPQIIKDYGDKIRYVFRDFPLAFHPNAQKAAEAAECAGEQNKFWEMHDKLFSSQEEWSSATDATKNFEGYASSLGLDTTKFNTCLEKGAQADEIKKDQSDGQKAGVTGTPTFFINGRKLVGARPYSAFKAIIDEELAK